MSNVRIITFCILLFSFLGTAVFAHTGSLTLHCSFNGKALTGDEYSVTKIADAHICRGEISYETLETFTGYDCRWDKLTGEQIREKAKQMKHVQPDGKEVTNSRGEASFRRLDPGVYLVKRTHTAEENKKYLTEPFLLFLPQRINGAMEYDITSDVKIAQNETGSGAIRTGEQIRLFGVVISFLLSLLVFLAVNTVSKLYRKKKAMQSEPLSGTTRFTKTLHMAKIRFPSRRKRSNRI